MASTNPDMAHIEALEEENRRMREALKEIIEREDRAWMPMRVFRSEHESELDDARHETWTLAADIARAALQEEARS